MISTTITAASTLTNVGHGIATLTIKILINLVVRSAARCSQIAQPIPCELSLGVATVAKTVFDLLVIRAIEPQLL